MPELPEVDSITMVVRRHAVGMSIDQIEVLRGKSYFGGESMDLLSQPKIVDVYRVGKYVMLKLSELSGGGYIYAHNAMTGYFDWEHEPWSFDYVEGPRDPNKTSDVRVRLHLSRMYDKGIVRMTLRFHDARLFGRMGFIAGHPEVGPELMETPAGFDRGTISDENFALSLSLSRHPVKSVVMDQDVVAGVGNIYANEACHLAGIDPRLPADQIGTVRSSILLEALRCVMAHSIPKVTYHWLKVYRRSTCGSCGAPIVRVEVAKRATFICERCQGDPK